MSYTNGWTAIADASKCFHNYQTLPEERELIGIIHPTTGEHLWYVGLPMGFVNSPSIACRFGEGILNLPREESPVYQGVRRLENTWRTALQTGKYNADIGHGYVFEQANGRPVAIVFGFVDDFFVHALTWSDCVDGLNTFMDLMVRLGLICQPVKTSPPAQVQKYCCFIYDTRGTPWLYIPPNKIARCIASATYLKSRPRIEHLSRLSLAVVTGVLQPIVAATPQHSGQVHLHALCNDLHRMEEVGHLQGAAKCHATVSLSAPSLLGLQWWIHHLEEHPGATTCRAHTRNGIVIKWGDGSGTSTGGTTELYPLSADEHEQNPNVELWMGVWHAKVKPYSSNWREARTILQALLQEVNIDRLRDTTVFVITDNLVSYYVVNSGSSRSPGLHALVEEIKTLTVQLGCRLEAVHAPGTLMIEQGTDGLSRGLWLTEERRSSNINQQLFQAVPYSPTLGRWACDFLRLPEQAFSCH